MTIDLSDLATELEEAVLPNGTPSPYTPEHAEAAAKVMGYESAAQRDEVDPPPAKRKRRTKAEMEAERAAQAAGKATANDTGSGETSEAPSTASADGLEPTPFDDVPTLPSERTLEAMTGVARDLGMLNDVPDVTETQVLVDELHFLRDDIRDLTAEVRKMALAYERSVEAQAKATEVLKSWAESGAVVKA